MRILFVCGAGVVYGKEIITLSLIEGLRVRGHEVRCVTSSWGSEEFARRLDLNGTITKSLPLGFISKTLSWPAALMTLHQIIKLPKLWIGYRRLLREFKPDVVVQNNFHHIFLLYPLLDLRHTVFHVHDFFAPTRFYRFVLGILQRRIRLFIGISHFITDSLIRVGVSKHKVATVLNGIPAEGLNGHHQAAESTLNHAQDARATSGEQTNGSKAPAIGIVGQVGEWKGHGELLEAMRILNERGVPLICKVFGSGDEAYMAQLKRKANEYGLGDSIQWTGFVEDRRAIYSDIDVCVIPSRSDEPFGLVAAEASFYGIPVVASRRGGLPEIVKDNETGYLYPQDSTESLADKLELLAKSTALRDRMGLAGRAHAKTMLTSERMVREMESLLVSLVSYDKQLSQASL